MVCGKYKVKLVWTKDVYKGQTARVLVRFAQTGKTVVYTPIPRSDFTTRQYTAKTCDECFANPCEHGAQTPDQSIITLKYI